MVVVELLPNAILHPRVVRLVVDPFSRHRARLREEFVNVNAGSSQSLRDVFNHVLRRYTHQQKVPGIHHARDQDVHLDIMLKQVVIVFFIHQRRVVAVPIHLHLSIQYPECIECR